jgi:hypothetical protein
MVDISLRGRPSPISDFPSGGNRRFRCLVGVLMDTMSGICTLIIDGERYVGFEYVAESGDTALGVGFHQRYFEGAQAGASEAPHKDASC